MSERRNPRRNVKFRKKKDILGRNVYDPTRTLTVRNRFTRRFNSLWGEIASSLRGLVGLTVLGERYNSDFPLSIDRNKFIYQTDQQRLAEADNWLASEFARVFYNPDGSSEELDLMIRASYNRGVKDAGKNVVGFRGSAFAGLSTQRSFAGFDVQDIFARPPVHIRAATLVYSRAFTQLKGITDSTAQQLSSNIASGVLRGDGADEITRTLIEKVDINKRRVQRIVRTEVVNAYSTGAIEEGERIAEELGYEEPLYLWQTAGDERVRPEHQTWDGKVYTKKEVLARIGAPNCRCSPTLWIPPTEEEE